jgi:addiction module HigA family antidote
MHNPPHPGKILNGLWLQPMGVSVTQAATALGVSKKTLSKLVNGKSGISPEMAFRLSLAFGGSPESWMGHQAAFDLWKSEQNPNALNVTPLQTHS